MADRKMRVRFKVAVDEYRKGDEAALPEAEAVRYIEGRCAIPLVEEKVERAVMDEPEEKRAKPKKKGGK